MLGLVGFLCFCTSVTVICDQTIPENVSTAVHLFTFPGPGEAFTPHLRSVLLHSSAVVHTNWNPVRQGRLVLSCGGQAMYLWSEEWIGEGGAEEEMGECVAIPASTYGITHILRNLLIFIYRLLQRNLKHETFVGRPMGRVYYFLIEKRFVVHSRLRNKLATLSVRKKRGS